MIDRFSLRSFLEFYAVIPLVLIALAGTYKFGYFLAFDALWILPSISSHSLFYSILVTALQFTFGSTLSLLYLRASDWFGHLYSGLFFIVLLILFVSALGIDQSLTLAVRLVPLYFGFIYYFYADASMFGGEIERHLLSPITLLLSVLAFVFMFASGWGDASKVIANKTLPVVIFDKQTSYPNGETDWRLLETIDTRFVLINLQNKTDYGYEMKVVEYSKVDSIY